MAKKDDPPLVANVITVDWADLQSPTTSASLLNSLELAYGAQGTGILAIRNVPGFLHAKLHALPTAWQLANLDPAYLETHLTDPDSLYNAGWSHGKEKLGDKPDTAKGSFYFNPVTDLPGTAADRAQYPLSYPANKWPTEKLPELEGQCKKLGCILKDAVVVLSRHLDVLAASKVDGYPEQLLYNNFKDTEKVKCRLLYYFPLDNTKTESSEDSWIGWHNDSGFLTALAGDLYVDHATGQPVECPDDRAGLYVTDRQDRVLKVHLPPDCMAVQMGECTQIVTGGAVSATPHCVCGTSVNQVARISLPCFVDTPPQFCLNMPEHCTRDQVLSATSPSTKVPPLAERWSNGMTFGDFLQKTFAMYYDWSSKK